VKYPKIIAIGVVSKTQSKNPGTPTIPQCVTAIIII